jgi:hypothetical protein
MTTATGFVEFARRIAQMRTFDECQRDNAIDDAANEDPPIFEGPELEQYIEEYCCASNKSQDWLEYDSADLEDLIREARKLFPNPDPDPNPNPQG